VDFDRDNSEFDTPRPALKKPPFVFIIESKEVQKKEMKKIGSELEEP
jgi:hypothetical protein